MELYEQLLEVALEWGMDIETFERSTFREVTLILRGKQRKIEREFKENLAIQYQMVDLMAMSIQRLLDKDAEKLPTLHQLYPSLFPEEEAQNEEVLAAAVAANTSRWKMYAALHNKEIRKRSKKED